MVKNAANKTPVPRGSYTGGRVIRINLYSVVSSGTSRLWALSSFSLGTAPSAKPAAMI